MNRKKIIVPLVLLVAIACYFVFFHKDKTLLFIPENADAVALVDVKKLTRQYISSFITHPSQWLDGKKTDKEGSSVWDAGVKIPDFLQIFHLKNTGFYHWYTVIELDDHQKFLSFLKKQKFINKGENLYQKDHIFLSIQGDHCMVGTSEQDLASVHHLLLQSSAKKKYNADQFIEGTTGSISFISGQKIRNFSVELKDDEVEIKNTSKTETFNALLTKVQQKARFLEIELDAENVKKFTFFFNKNNTDIPEITHYKATAELEQVNDTIVTYGYDDNFNEIEKKTFQKITQPKYVIRLQSPNPEKTWEYFQNKKWINSQNQFTIIPFQPNSIYKNKEGIVIESTENPIQLSPDLRENYIFIKNDALLSSSASFINKGILSTIDYIFYGNKAEDYYIRLQGKKGKLPLILRW
ncbi:hypothetical protein N6B72_07585 [Chryseobacterium soli]|uniref:hypothetical protein n=1 Tax=Chryseobacterium soli TaxID=445961 RepID=UPI002953D384|nr:hypothetical protein [Chryseobacterium soli]MDV7696776.1 hypothetical protein [Chryseobacterium soli]